MRYVADTETRERRLLAAESAAASAVGNGCDPDEVRARVEAGIAEAIAMNNRQPGEHFAGRTESEPAPGALDAWVARVNGTAA